MEYGIVSSAQESNNPNLSINTQFTEIKKQIEETERELARLENNKELFVLEKYNYKVRWTILTAKYHQNPEHYEGKKSILQIQFNNDRAKLKSQAEYCMTQGLNLGQQLQETVAGLSSVQDHILNLLFQWKEEQHLVGNGAPFFESRLDIIQNLCETLADFIFSTKCQIEKAEQLKLREVFSEFTPDNLPIMNTQDVLPQLKGQIKQLLISLVTRTFVIEKQPPQVMRTNTKFSAKVRLLVGGKFIMNKAHQVIATIYNEAQAQYLMNSKMIVKGNGSEVLNNSSSIRYDKQSRHMSATFSNMRLQKIKRAEKKVTETVMDEKCCFLFTMKFEIDKLFFEVWTLSLPVVVIVHGTQEPQAWSTIMWDNAFSEPGRVLFTVPEKVPWPRVAEVLNMKFSAATGRSLNEENLRFLARKAFRTQASDYSNMYLSWSQFCKEPLPGRNFSFWEWFYSIMKFTKDHLKEQWMDGLIMGFVDRGQAENMLLSCVSGTFMLRFSESMLGGITIAWVTRGESKHVCMVEPFSSSHLITRSLADSISDLPHLVNLYPGTPKEQAFDKYRRIVTENQPILTDQGYVKQELKIHIAIQPGTNLGNQSGQSLPHLPAVTLQPQSPTMDDLSLNNSLWLDIEDYNLELSSPLTDFDLNFDILAPIPTHQI